MKTISIIFGVVVLVAILLVAGVRAYFVKKAFANLTPEEIEMYEAWRTEKLEFPQEDIEAKPFGEATLVSARVFREKWDEHKDLARDLAIRFSGFVKTGQPAEGSPEWKAVLEDYRKVEPLVAAFEDLVGQPEYDLLAVPPGKDPAEQTGYPSPNYLAYQIASKHLALKSVILTREGRHAEAQQAAETIIRASKTPKYSTLISKLIGIAGFQMGAETWHRAVTDCDDPAVLRRALERQNALVPKSEFIPTDISIMIYDQVGMILEAKRHGVKIQVQGLTGREITGESFRAQGEYLNAVVLPLVQDDPKRLAEVRSAIKGSRSSAAMAGAKAHNLKEVFLKWGGGMATPFLYSMALPNFSTANIRGDVARSHFDLLRIHTARKLFALEKRREPSGIAELVPEYLPEAPKDVFAKGNQGYGFNKDASYPAGDGGEKLHPEGMHYVQGAAYSIGPDGEDQGGAVTYDSTNGTMSKGDVLLGIVNRE